MTRRKRSSQRANTADASADRALASPLGRRVPRSFDAGGEKQRGWRELGILVINPESDALSWAERALVQALGERLYGKRPNDTPPEGPHGGA